MEIYLGLLISFVLLLVSVINKVYIGYTLIACLFLFVLVALKRGHGLKASIKMVLSGGNKSFVVIKMLIIIGAVIGIWMSSGTIPTIIFYCLKYITPNTFFLSSFLICCVTSFLIGTSVGTVSTVGIPLMIIGRNGNVSLNILAGAIIAGAYFGDRCSPMSSSAALVANLTKTNIFINIKNMFYTSVIPFTLTLVFYFALSLHTPLRILNNNLSNELQNTFNIKFIMLLPAIVILVLSLFKINIKISILASIVTASILSMLYQHHNILSVIYNIVMGYKMDEASPLQSIIKGGGMVSMLKTCFVVYSSCSLAGVFEGINMFDKIKASLNNTKLPMHKSFVITSLVSIATAAFGCTQSIAIIMTNQILNRTSNEAESYQFALDLENSGILLSALIPWNIAALVPTTTLNVSATGFLPYAFYLYIFPIVYFLNLKFFKKNTKFKIYTKQSAAS